MFAEQDYPRGKDQGHSCALSSFLGTWVAQLQKMAPQPAAPSRWPAAPPLWFAILDPELPGAFGGLCGLSLRGLFLLFLHGIGLTVLLLTPVAWPHLFVPSCLSHLSSFPLFSVSCCHLDNHQKIVFCFWLSWYRFFQRAWGFNFVISCLLTFLTDLPRSSYFLLQTSLFSFFKWKIISCLISRVVLSQKRTILQLTLISLLGSSLVLCSHLLFFLFFFKLNILKHLLHKWFLKTTALLGFLSVSLSGWMAGAVPHIAASSTCPESTGKLQSFAKWLASLCRDVLIQFKGEE